MGSGGLFIVAGTPPVQVIATFLLHFWKQLAFQEMVLEMPYHKMKYILASGTKQSLTNGLKHSTFFLLWRKPAHLEQFFINRLGLLIIPYLLAYILK